MRTFPWKSKFSLLAGALMMCVGILALTGQAASDFMVVKPAAANNYLANPGIGWQSSGGANILPETVTYPDRADIAWAKLNPSRGVYDWSALDTRINQAAAAGKQASFRVYTMRGETWGGHQIPQWVISTGGILLSSGEPNYSSCNYQENWATFVQALRQRYDGNPNVAYIDISGYGNFNEWSWHNQTVFDDNALNPTSLDGKARRRLADMFIGGSNSSHQCQGSNGQTQTVSYNYPGFRTSQLVMPFAGVRQSIQYVTSRRSDVGIRHDCLGRDTSGTINAIGAQLEATWRNAPVIYELCSGISTSNTDFNAVQTMLRFSHGSLVHDNTPGSPREASRMDELMRYLGYRYQLSEASYPRSVAAGTSLNLSMIWQNVGYAPAYPRMGQSFSLRAYLVDSSNNIISQQASTARIEQWMPAHPLPGTPPNNLSNVSLPVPANASGTYSVRVAIIDQRTQQPINLAIAGRDSRGHYRLGDLIVGSGAVVQPPTQIPSPTATQLASANQKPVISPVADQTSTVGSPINLQISASDPENRPLRFTADSLPGGLSINAGNGLISGTLQSGGQFNVSVGAIDDAGQNATLNFRWTVNGGDNNPVSPVNAPVSIMISGTSADQLSTEFTYRLRNESSSNVSGLSVRVYFTTEPGLAASAYELKSYWDQSGAASVSAPTHVSGDLYYYTISYGSTSLRPGTSWEWYGSMHLRNWSNGINTNNDWWKQGSYTSTFTATNTLPVYVNNTLVLGSDPNGATPPVVNPPVVNQPLPTPIPPVNAPLPTPIPPVNAPLPTPIPPVNQPPVSSSNVSVSLSAGTDKQNSTELRFEMRNNGSSQNNISARIYFSPDNGRAANGYMLETYWDSVGGAQITGPFSDGSRHYFAISYGNREFAGGANWIWQGVIRTTDWSNNHVSGNDWWKQGGFSTTLSATTTIPVYANGSLIAGRQP